MKVGPETLGGMPGVLGPDRQHKGSHLADGGIRVRSEGHSELKKSGWWSPSLQALASSGGSQGPAPPRPATLSPPDQPVLIRCPSGHLRTLWVCLLSGGPAF